MNTKRNIVMFALLCVTSELFAQVGRIAVARTIVKEPSILEESWFWIAVVVCLVLVGIYAIVKDKDK